jgi:hypothetical protein
MRARGELAGNYSLDGAELWVVGFRGARLRWICGWEQGRQI